MKKFFFFAAALFAAISFAACSDDDEPGLPATPESIAGTWQITHEKGWEIYDGEKEVWSENYPDEEGGYYTYTFDKNGSFTESSYKDNELRNTYNSSYSISGNELTIKNGGYPTFEIKKLTGSQLVLFESENGSDGSWESTMVFRRIE